MKTELVTSRQAELILVLWSTCRYDSLDIARLVQVSEAAVCRTVQAARDLVRGVRA